MSGIRIRKGTRPTLEQKKIITGCKSMNGKNLDPDNWLISKESSQEIWIFNKTSFKPYPYNPIKKSCLESHCNG